jgi:hypothetical protein
MSDLSRVTRELREALDAIEGKLRRGAPPPDALEDFKATLDDVRTTVHAIVTAADSSDYQEFVRRFRLRRAAQVCQSVVYGIQDGTLGKATPGFDRLIAIVDETLERLEVMDEGGG